jgi:hypothetical protein
MLADTRPSATVKLDKKPAIDGWQANATTDVAQITTWFTVTFPTAIPGIQLDKSNLFVVDLDRHPGGADGTKNFKEFRGENPAPQCPMVKTPSGGYHLYFRQPDGERLTNRAGAFPAGIDCRGKGGWTVGPGAVFGPWQWVDETADEALEQPSDPTHKDDAVKFLRQVLASGEMLVPDIEAEARAARVLGESQSISQSKPFRVAREALGIEPKKSSMSGGWVWALPSS